ncbi:MAG: hypothetical protein ACR2NU_12470 [Aeoliella sp.]
MKLTLPRVYTTLLKCAVVSISFAVYATAAPQAAESESLEDLGAELLDSDLLDSLLAPTESLRADEREAAPSDLLPNVDELRRQLDSNPQPPAGEDLGQQGEPPLLSISNHMQHAGQLIAAQDMTGETRNIQDTIVSELDELIEKLNKQCQSCSGGKCDKPEDKQQSQSSTPKPGAGKPSASESEQSKPTQSQISQGGGGEAELGDSGSTDVVKKLWGQLPKRLRQQLLQSSADEFLPKYREDIEAYFRRLAEEQRSEPSAR